MYEQRVKLKDNETLATVDTETGEFKLITKRPNNIPENKEKFVADAKFSKQYSKSWLYLLDNLSLVEIKIANRMSVMAEHTTNSLAPLDDKTTVRELADYFGIGINSVKKAFKHLFDLGVYASFEYCHYQRGHVKEWIFNPFISFKGVLIDSDIKELFINTKVAKAFFE